MKITIFCLAIFVGMVIAGPLDKRNSNRSGSAENKSKQLSKICLKIYFNRISCF